MSPAQGDVWWGPAPHKNGPAYRPWLVVNDDSHPFSRVECIVVAMTTKPRSEAINVPDDAWVRGGSRKDAHISPWYVATIKHRDLENQQGKLTESLVADARRALHGYTALQQDEQ